MERRTDLRKHIRTTEHYMPPAYQWRGIKKEKEGEDVGGAAEVSDLFYKESKSKKQNFFWAAGKGGGDGGRGMG